MNLRGWTWYMWHVRTYHWQWKKIKNKTKVEVKKKCGQDVDGEKKKLPRKDEQDRKKWKQDGKNLLIEKSMPSEETSKFVWSNNGFHFSGIVVCSTAEPRTFLHRKCCVVRLRGQEGLHHAMVKIWALFHRKRPTAWPQSWTIRLNGPGHHTTSGYIHWVRKACIELRISTSCRGSNTCELYISPRQNWAHIFPKEPKCAKVVSNFGMLSPCQYICANIFRLSRKWFDCLDAWTRIGPVTSRTFRKGRSKLTKGKRPNQTRTKLLLLFCWCCCCCCCLVVVCLLLLLLLLLLGYF